MLRELNYKDLPSCQKNRNALILQTYIHCIIMKTSYLVFLFILLVLSSGSLIQATDFQPHSRACYTQGIFFLNDTHIFQSCGLYNKSYFHIMQYNASPFELIKVYESNIPWKINIFLEGSVLFKGFIYMLTWRENSVYKLDPTTFELAEQLTWDKDGWGLTTNGTHMFTTDGSDNIYVVDEKFKLVERKAITNLSGRQLYNINELEYANGFIYANVYFSQYIYKIDYEKGKAVASYDGSNLINSQPNLKTDEVINGIAYDRKNNKFLLTGKDWSKIYQVSL